ncbi:hypothetical protein KVP09_13380 [Alcaligenaceae bacterium CGII-47]|nr:hypothetical protein [Alcaligenaceae bacterium CGII-47]
MSQESIRVKEAVALGKRRFFEQHPQLLAEADAAADQEAAIRDSGLADLREVARYRVIASFAKGHNQDSFAMLLELGTDSPEQFQQLIAAQNTHIKKSIGM